jgi:hypothetical protein
MPRPRRAAAGHLWQFGPDHRTSALDRIVIEQQRVSPCCPNGVTNRLAERQYHAPYRWIVVGYRCSVCGAMWCETGVNV